MYQTYKTYLCDRLIHERDKLEFIVNRVGFVRRLTMKGASDSYSVKEVMAQILAHEQFISDRLQEALQGENHIPSKTQAEYNTFLEKFGHPDFNSPLLRDNKSNEWIADKYRNIPFDEIVSHEIQAYLAVSNGLEQMPDERLIRHDFIHRVAKHTYRYYRYHTIKISAWLKVCAVNPR